MKKLFNCLRCGYSTNYKHVYKSHLNRKKTCKPSLSNIPIELLKETFDIQLPPKPVIPLIISNDEVDRSGYIYLIREREFIRMQEDVYKAGKTTKPIDKRFKQYPKKSELIVAIHVEDCHKAETKLLKLLRANFIQRRDIGAEYFEGNNKAIRKMFQDFL